MEAFFVMVGIIATGIFIVWFIKGMLQQAKDEGAAEYAKAERHKKEWEAHKKLHNLQ